MTAQQRTEDAKTRTMIRLLATFGVRAPLTFAASALTQSLARDEHNLLRDPISALAAGPAGWMQDVTDDNAPHTIAGLSPSAVQGRRRWRSRDGCPATRGGPTWLGTCESSVSFCFCCSWPSVSWRVQSARRFTTRSAYPSGSSSASGSHASPHWPCACFERRRRMNACVLGPW